MNLKNKNGITIVALLVTIILLLILAGVSIAEFTGHGLFAQAQRAKLEEKRSTITEWLSIKLIEEQTNNPSGTAEKIIGATRENVINNQNELEKMGKDINIEEISNEENGEQVEVYFYVIVDEDVYKVELEGVKFIGRKGEFPPIIRITGVTNTTNTITVTVETQRNEEGKIEYWIKAEDEEEYRKIGETEGEEKSYIYEGLIQNKKYNIKVIAIAKNEKTAEATAEETTGSVPDLTDADIEFTYNPKEWTNGSVKVTASANIDITGYTLKLSTDLKTWSNSVTRTTNGKVYAKLSDNTNQYGDKYATGNVTNIDTTKPTIDSVTGVTIVSGNTGNIAISGVVDTGGSGLNAYYISTNSTTPTANTSGWVTNTASSFTKAVTTAGTYYVWVKDNAGNISNVKSCTVTVQTAVASIGTTYYANVANAVSATSTSTITLLVNQTESVTIPSGKNITFNLNGKTLTGSVTNNGTLVLKGGTLSAITNTGNLTFQSGTVSGSGVGWAVNNTGTFTMTGGTINHSTSDNGTALMNQGTLNMSGGTINSAAYGLVTRGGTSNVRGSGITIQAGTSSTSPPAILNDNKGGSIYEGITISGYIYKEDNNCKLTLYDCNITGVTSIVGNVIRVDGTSDGYKVYLYDNDQQYSKVEFPSWGVSNGQNDLIWHNGIYYTSRKTLSGPSTGYWYYQVKKSEHNNETGLYNTHVYVNGSTMVQPGIEYTVE